MKENQLKEKTVLDLGVQFDEAVELFSEETLNSMRMEKIVGGETQGIICININIDVKCSQCSCPGPTHNPYFLAECPQNGYTCVTLDIPSVPQPSLVGPTTKLLN